VSKTYVALDDKRLAVSNLEKDLYPSYGFTKARVLDYYRRMAPVILPHLRDRALTLKRYPEGTEKEYFYEKRCPSHRPPWVQTAAIPQDHGESLNACLVNDIETLMWVENLASLELHVPLAKATAPRIADAMVFDLDPGAPANIVDCGRVACSFP
jgi:bifunctional non-homologous end joining protein LigD